MKKTLRQLARLFAFAALLALTVCFANAYCVRIDGVTALTLGEMRERDDIELAVVGSSVARNHFNPALISQRTGLTAFNAAALNASLQGAIAVTEEMLQTSRPQWIVLALDFYNLNTAKEEMQAEYVLMPLLKNWRTKLDYYQRLCREDGAYIDRLLLFRYQFALPDVARNVTLRHDAGALREQIQAAMAPGLSYMGEGYLRYDTDATPDADIRRLCVGEKTPGYVYDLLPSTQRMLLEYAALCEQSGAKLMIAVTPNHTASLLAKPEALPYYDSLAAFCAQSGIPCFNFNYAKPELLERLDPYYYDLFHFNAEGSDLFSEAFARVFNLLVAGEDASDLFYADSAAYRDSLDFITNAWFSLDRRTNTFTADCNRGASVEPEYRYALIGADGGETLLRDYDGEPSLTVDVPEGCALRVYARVRGQEDAEPVYYDYPADFAVHFRD